MARIRSVKPDLCTDERFAECSPTARLLFILLQSFCDDGGVHPAKIRTLKAEVFPMDETITSADVEAWISELISSRLMGEFQSGDEIFWFVRDWSTLQKIERPSRRYPGPNEPGSIPIRRTFGKQSVSDRQPAGEQSPTDSPSVADASPPDGGKEGVDKYGKDGLEFATTPDGDGSPAAPKFKSSPGKEPGRTSATWDAYSKSYLARYGAEPIRNQTINGQLAKLVDQLGAEEAPQVAAFYVRHDGAFYVREMHPVSLLLRDVSKLRTEWITGRNAEDRARRAGVRGPQDFSDTDYREGLTGGLLKA